MLEKLMTVGEFCNFEEELSVQSNGYPMFIDWNQEAMDYLGALMTIDSSFVEAQRIDFRKDGSIWIKMQGSEGANTEDRTIARSLLADRREDGNYVIQDGFIRIALSPVDLLEKRQLTCGYRLRFAGSVHETQLNETALMLGEEAIMEVSFPKYMLFRRHLLVCLSSYRLHFQREDIYSTLNEIEGITLPEIASGDHSLRKEFAIRSRNRMIYRMKVKHRIGETSDLPSHFLTDLEKRTNPFWWIAADLEMTAIQQLQRAGVMPVDVNLPKLIPMY